MRYYYTFKKSILLFILINALLLFCYNVFATNTPFAYKIEGLTGDALNNATTQLNLMIKHLGDKPSNNQLNRFYENASDAIKQAIQPFGYFKAQVRSHLNKNKTPWHARFTVTPGPVMLVNQVDIRITGDGANLAEFANFKRKFPLHTGDPLNAKKYKQAKNNLFKLAQKYGYLNGKMLQQALNIDLIHYQANITLHFDTGKRFYFGKTKFNKTLFNPEFLSHFLPYKSGEPFSNQTISKTQSNFNDSNYFTSVSVTPMQQANNQDVPIDIHLVPKPSQDYHVGGGYGTDTGMRGLLGWDWNNITDTGQHFSAKLQAALEQSNLQGTYYIPGRDPLKQQYTLGAGLQIDDISGRSKTANVTAGYMFNTDTWQRSVSLSYQIENFTVEGQSQQHSKLLMPTLNISRTNADDTIFTTNGNKINLILKSGAKALASSVNFVQADLQGKLIRTFYDDNRILLRAEYGRTFVDNQTLFPLSQRFFAGGSESIRGYSYKEFGPDNSVVTASAEIQRRVYGKWYATGFFDTGDTFNGTFSHPLKSAAGIGVMYASPIGPLELTLARPLNHGFRSYSIQFTMGPDL